MTINASVPIPYQDLAFENFLVHNALLTRILEPATPPNYLFGASDGEITIWYPNSCVQSFNLKQLSYSCGSMASTDSCNVTFTGLYTAEKAKQTGISSISTTWTYLAKFASGAVLMDTRQFAPYGDRNGLQSVDVSAVFNGPTTPGLAALISMDQVLYDTVGYRQATGSWAYEGSHN